MRCSVVAAFMLVAGQASADAWLDDHPLVDVVVDVRSGQVIERAALEARLAEADFVLLGEKHDNARHHAIQAELVDRLGAFGRLRAVAVEMLPTDRQAALTEGLAGDGDMDELAAAVGWEELGWGPWAWFEPIVEATHRHGATLVAANLPRADIGLIFREGLAALDRDFRVATGLDQPLEADDQAAREALMVAVHCGHPLGERAAAMVAIQRARDARMAERLALLSGTGQGVLITGNAHAANSAGVPVKLARLRPEATVVSLGLIEVRAAWTDVPDEVFDHDYVWFTPRAQPEDHDYCAGFRPG